MSQNTVEFIVAITMPCHRIVIWHLVSVVTDTSNHEYPATIHYCLMQFRLTLSCEKGKHIT